jgi:hypothetical protein
MQNQLRRSTRGISAVNWYPSRMADWALAIVSVGCVKTGFADFACVLPEVALEQDGGGRESDEKGCQEDVPSEISVDPELIPERYGDD